MTIRHYRLVRNHPGSDRKECLRRNLRRNILYKKKKKERKKERKKEESRSLWLKTSVACMMYVIIIISKLSALSASFRPISPFQLKATKS